MSSKPIPEQHQKKLNIIATYLRELRFNEGLTQKELSQTMNLHRNTVIRAENSKNLTLLSFFELADALDINPKELLDIE
jgi:transcriptional regulator with XRE-family HTH domain